MSLLTADQIIETKVQPQRLTLKLVDGALEIFAGSILDYELSNIGYVKAAAVDTQLAAYPEFAGIAMENKTITAGNNASDGDNDIEVIPRGSGEYVKLVTSSTITIANEGDLVYVDGSGAADIAANVFNVTGGLVGIIRQFISGNSAWVQLVQHPNKLD